MSFREAVRSSFMYADFLKVNQSYSLGVFREVSGADTAMCPLLFNPIIMIKLRFLVLLIIHYKSMAWKFIVSSKKFTFCLDRIVD